MLELFLVFFKMGLFTIGGGIAMIPILRQAMVEDKKWFDDEEMLDIITVCQSLPGVIAINMATFVGFKRRKFLGSLVATFGVILPSFVIIIFIAMGLNFIKDNPYVLGAMGGLRAAATGMVAYATYTIGKVAIKDDESAILAVSAFILMAFMHISIMVIISMLIILGVIKTYLNIKKMDDDL